LSQVRRPFFLGCHLEGEPVDRSEKTVAILSEIDAIARDLKLASFSFIADF
jgi:hypothetical protein